MRDVEWNIRVKARGLLIGLVAAAVVIPALVVAGTVTLPYTFSNNTVADAEQVNGNFTALATGVNDNASRLAAIEPAGAYYASTAAFVAAGGSAYFPLHEPGPRSWDKVVAGRYVEGSERLVEGPFRGTSARYFDTITDVMRAPSGTWPTGNAAHTFVITFRTWGAPGSFMALASLGWTETASRNHAVALNSTLKLGGGFYSDDYWTSLDASQTAIPLNTWTQAAFAYDPTTRKSFVYRNGTLLGSSLGGAGAVVKNFTSDFAVGGWIHTATSTPEKPVKLSIAEVAFYGTTLDATAIAAIHAGSFAVGKRIVAP